MAFLSNVLSFKNVTLKFGGITALNSVNFSIEPGELYAIIGPNGAGKTSIFNCISGIYKPTEGEVVYGENTLSKLRPDQIASLGIARTFQNIELFENLTVIDNILIGAHRKLNYGPISSLLYSKKAKRVRLKHALLLKILLIFLKLNNIDILT